MVASVIFINWKPEMSGFCKIATAVFTLISALAFIGECAIAGEPSAEVKVVSSDSASRFVALAVSKSLVIDLPRDAKEVLVANPKIVNAVQRTNRRTYLIGSAIGQTNVFIYDDKGREIVALNVYVTPDTPPGSMSKLEPYNEVVVYRGSTGARSTQNCSHSACITAAESLPELPPGYTNISHNSIRP